MMLPKINLLKVLSIGGTILGLASTLVSEKANDKKMQQLIDSKVAEALSKTKE